MFAEEKSFVATAVADDFDLWVEFGVALDESTDGRGEARRESASGEQRDFFDGFCFSHNISGCVDGKLKLLILEFLSGHANTDRSLATNDGLILAGESLVFVVGDRCWGVRRLA